MTKVPAYVSLVVALIAATECGGERTRDGAEGAGDHSPSPRTQVRATDTVSATADTTISFGVVTRDLTGDSIPETLTLTGVGKTIDDLAVSFTIRSSDQILYTRNWRLTRASFDPRGGVSDHELRTRLAEYGAWFFDASKFKTPAGFVSELQSSARLHIPMIPQVIARQMGDSVRAGVIWREMQAAPITTFAFSPGGDLVMTIGWSATDRQFYNLLECC